MYGPRGCRLQAREFAGRCGVSLLAVGPDCLLQICVLFADMLLSPICVILDANASAELAWRELDTIFSDDVLS